MNHLRTSTSQCRNLLHRIIDVGGIRICHRLHNNRRIRTHANPTNINCYRTSTLYLWHKLSTLKFTIRNPADLAMH